MLYLISLFTIFQTYNIIWENTVIEIPLYESVEDYLYLPEAKLYDGSKQIVDYDFYYEYGVNHTFVSVVNSNHVKSFFVDYKVYFPNQNLSSIQTIEFKIIDITPPSMIYVPELKSPLGSRVIDIKKDIIYEDNYYSKNDIQVFIDTSKVNINKVGIYEVVYTLVDKSLNQKEHIASYEVYDETPPMIKLKKDLYHEIKTPFRWQNYFSITDNDPNNLKVIINDNFVNYNELGKYIITIEAIDNSFNRTVYEDVIEVVDTTPPKLELTSNPKHIEVLSRISELDLLDYVILASDNETNYNELKWQITHDIDTSRIGTYQINYQLFDNSNNKTEKTIKIQVLDTLPPVITLIKPLSFDVFSEDINILDHFNFKDNFDNDFDLKVKIDGKINYKKVGSYPISITATDLSKNESVYRTNVEVVDNEPPLIIPLKEIVVNPNEFIDLDDYFIFEDNYDDNLVVYFDIPSSLSDVGSYDSYVEVSDSSNNVSTYYFEIVVIDLIAPKITLKQESITIEEGEELDFKDYILNVYDEISLVDISDVIIDDSSFRNKRGLYKIDYILFDEALNKGISSLYVFVIKSDDVKFEVKNLSKKPNQIINHKEGLTIEGDNYEYYFFGESSYEKEGKYTLTHIIITESGKLYNINQQVIVAKAFNARKHVIPLLTIAFSIMATLFLLIKRPKSNTNSFDKQSII